MSSRFLTHLKRQRGRKVNISRFRQTAQAAARVKPFKLRHFLTFTRLGVVGRIPPSNRPPDLSATSNRQAVVPQSDSPAGQEDRQVSKERYQ
jgi:hypothetical protein